jgi:hypothetical protein
MKSPWVITPKGKLIDRAIYDQQDFRGDLKKAFDELEKYKLREFRIIMNQDDWEDLMKFSQGEGE